LTRHGVARGEFRERALGFDLRGLFGFELLDDDRGDFTVID
jgi:hypothetical protein